MVPEKPRPKPSRASQIAQAYLFANEILSGAIGLALLTWGGSWLDGRYGLKPWLTIAGACAGFLVAGISLRRLIQRLDRDAAAKRSGDGSSDRSSEFGEGPKLK